MPEGSDRPVRESRAEVRAARFSNATVAFDFAPIPDSGGATYTLAVGVLSGPKPHVFLGLTGDVIREGAAVVNGAPTRYADDLAMRASWRVRLIEGLIPRDPRHWLLIGEGVMNIFLWVFLVVATWAGLSGRGPRFWAHLRLALSPHQRPYHGRHHHRHPCVPRGAVAHAARVTAAAR